MKINFRLSLALLLAVLYGCMDKTKINKTDILWVNIFNTNKKTEFCQIDNFSDKEILLTYSFPFTINGGCNVEKISFINDSIFKKNLLKNEINVISFAFLNRNKFYIVKEDFIVNSLKSDILVLSKDGLDWDIIQTPVENPRKLFFLNIYLVEGNLKGTGQVFKSLDSGKSWSKIDFEDKFKSLYLLNNTVFENEILCVAAKEYNNSSCKLILLNTSKSTIKEMISINKPDDYISPISKNKNLHIIKNGNEFELYKFNNREFKKLDTFAINIDFMEVKNIYLNKNIYIITGTERGMNKKTLSWISNDSGNTWTPFNQDKEYSLIYSSNGDLYVKDNQYNVLKGIVNN